MELVFEQGLPKRLFDFAFASMSCLPPIEPDCANDFVDVIDDSSNHDRGLSALGFLEKIGEGRLSTVDVFFDRGFAFHFDDILGKIEKLFQEIDTEKQTLLMPVLQIFEPLGQCVIGGAILGHGSGGVVLSRAA